MYVFLFIMVLLTPAIMILFGKAWQASPPKDINDYYGYRTKRSMLSQDTWNFAHQYFGKLWIWYGVTLIVGSTIAMFIFRSVYEAASIYIIGVQIIILCLPIIPTEQQLKKRFDRFGRKREEV